MADVSLVRAFGAETAKAETDVEESQVHALLRAARDSVSQSLFPMPLGGAASPRAIAENLVGQGNDVVASSLGAEEEERAGLNIVRDDPSYPGRFVFFSWVDD